MKIIFIVKGSLETQVPIVNQIKIALHRKHAVHIICTNCIEQLRDEIEEMGAAVYCTKHKKFGKIFLRKIWDWTGFKINCWRIIDSIDINDAILYIGSADTALAIGRRLLKYKYIFHISELYDKFPLYLHAIKKYSQRAIIVVVPEYCRANILRNWLELKKLPLTIPNKPFDHERTPNLLVTDPILRKAISELKGKKIFLYQGQIYKERNILDVARALRLINNDQYVLVLMGIDHSNMVNEIRNSYPNTYYVGYIPAPYHLKVTSHAYIGIVTYDDSSLNNLFCAPNKIYEYGGYGIPMLARDIPGLRYSVGLFNAGICTDFENMERIKEAINEIDENHQFYSKNANKLFDSLDLNEMFGEIESSLRQQDQ